MASGSGAAASRFAGKPEGLQQMGRWGTRHSLHTRSRAKSTAVSGLHHVQLGAEGRCTQHACGRDESYGGLPRMALGHLRLIWLCSSPEHAVARLTALQVPDEVRGRRAQQGERSIGQACVSMVHAGGTPLLPPARSRLMRPSRCLSGWCPRLTSHGLYYTSYNPPHAWQHCLSGHALTEVSACSCCVLVCRPMRDKQLS